MFGRRMTGRGRKGKGAGRGRDESKAEGKDVVDGNASEAGPAAEAVADSIGTDSTTAEQEGDGWGESSRGHPSVTDAPIAPPAEPSEAVELEAPDSSPDSEPLQELEQPLPAPGGAEDGLVGTAMSIVSSLWQWRTGSTARSEHEDLDDDDMATSRVSSVMSRQDSARSARSARTMRKAVKKAKAKTKAAEKAAIKAVDKAASKAAAKAKPKRDKHKKKSKDKDIAKDTAKDTAKKGKGMSKAPAHAHKKKHREKKKTKPKQARHHLDVLPVAHRPLAGTTLPHDSDGSGQVRSWAASPASFFKVRQLGYMRKETKHKAPSEEALYDLVGMDLLKADERIEQVSQFVRLPPPREVDDVALIRRGGLPRIIVVNLQIPLKAPTPWAGHDAGASLVWYFAVKPETAAAAASDATPKAVALLQRFCDGFDTNKDLRRRFKAIGIADNIADLNLGSAGKFNGKPVILFKTASVWRTRVEEDQGKDHEEDHEEDEVHDEEEVHEEERMGQDCLEIVVHMQKFNVVARGLFNQLRDRAPKVLARGGFLIQGEGDAELPEVMLGCSKLQNLDLTLATHMDDLIAAAAEATDS